MRNAKQTLTVTRVLLGLKLKQSEWVALKCGRQWRARVAARVEMKRQEKRIAAARRIQRWWRAEQARRRILTVDGVVIGDAVKKLMAEEAAALLAQQLQELEIAAFMAKHVLSAEKRGEMAVRKLQLRFRQKKAAEKLMRLKREYACGRIRRWFLSWRKRHSAVKIQAMWRSSSTLKEYQALRAIVLRIQAHWRGLVARRRVAILRKQAVRAGEEELKLGTLLNFMKKGTKEYLEVLVKKLQARWRAKMARRKLALEIEWNARGIAARKVQRFFKSRRKEAELREVAAVKIQALYKGRTTKLAFDSLKRITEKIQRVWRGALARARVRMIRADLKRLEDLEKEAAVAQALYARQSDAYLDLAVRKLQARWRAKVLRRKLGEVERKSREEAAAKQMQVALDITREREERLSTRKDEILAHYRDGDLISMELERNYSVIKEEEDKDKDDLAVCIPKDINGLIKDGRFISGPLKDSWVIDQPASDWLAEQFDIFKMVTMERIIDVSAAALAIQTFWRVKNISFKLPFAHRVVVRQLAALRARNVLCGKIAETSGFNGSLVNPKAVSLSNDCRVATYTARKGLNDFYGYGVLIGQDELPLITDKYPCVYFEVEVMEMLGGRFMDGLTLGVTDTVPSSSVPETCDGLPGMVWAVGFDGESFSSETGDFEKIDWNPKSLQVGDRVGCLVIFPAGDMIITVNGDIVSDGPTGIPMGTALYPVVDMLGAVTRVKWSSWDMIPAVELADGTESRVSAVDVSMESYNVPELLSSLRFADNLLNPTTLKVSPDHLTLSYVAPKRAPAKYMANGVAVTENPIDLVNGNMLYFEVELLESMDEFPDGLTIGFTDIKPKDVEQMPDICDGLPGNTWVAGFDGEFFSSTTGEFEELGWNPNSLKVGDKMGALIVYPAGDLIILVNGDVIAEGPTGLPRDVPLFGVVDLIGSANAVRIVSNPQIPEIQLAE